MIDAGVQDEDGAEPDLVELMLQQPPERVEYVPPVRGYDDAAEAWLAWADSLRLPKGE